jgi:hypothetical protein
MPTGNASGADMEIAGAGYLYTLALLSITYAGFAALFMLFRQEQGGRMAEYDAFLIRGVVQKGFIVTACSMLPPLLAYCDLPLDKVWRLSSFSAGALQVLFLINWVTRWVRTKGLPTSPWLMVNLGLQALNALYLFVGASEQFFPAGPGHFLIGVSLILFLSGIRYQEALVFLLQDRPAKKRRR